MSLHLQIVSYCKATHWEMWDIRIKQHFQIQDYALWEVVENGNSWVLISQSTEDNRITTLKMSTPATAEEKIKKENDVKARATKKTQKTHLKQQYENFSATSTDSLDSIFNRLQKIVSRLTILGVIIAQEDLNLKFLSSLPPEWDTHVVVWMNKPKIETMSIDDLYSNFKIKFNKDKEDSCPSVNTASPQVCTASVSDNTVYAFMVENPNGSNVLHQDLEQIHEDDLEAMDLKWQLSLLSVRAKKYYQKTGKKIFINSNDIAGYDKSKVECYNCHKLGHFARECRASRSKEDQFRNQDNTRKQGNKEDTSKAMLAIDGVGFDWSEMAEEQVQSNMALMAFSDSEVYTDKTCSKTCLNNYETLKKQYDDLLAKQLQTKFESATYKRGLDTVEAQLVTYRKNEVLFSEEVVVLKREVEFKQYEINTLKAEFEKLKKEKDNIDFKIEKFDKASKDLDQLLESQITDKSKKGFGYSAVPPPHPLIYNRPNKLDLSYYGLDEFKGYGPENSKKESNIVKESDNSKENYDKSLVKELESQVKSRFVKGCGSNTSERVSEVEPKKFRENKDAPIIEDWESDDEEQDESITKPEKKTITPSAAKIEKPVRKSVRYAEMYRSQRPRGNQRNWNGQKSIQLGSEFVMYNKACFNCGSFNHVQRNCTYHQKKKVVSGNNYNRVDTYYYAKTSHYRTHKNVTPRAVLLRTGLKPLSIAKPVYTAYPKPTVHCARPKTYFFKSAQSTVQRPFYKKPALTNRHFNHKVNTVRPIIVNTARSYRTPVNTVTPRVINTARQNRTSVNAARVNGFNAIKPSACWVLRPIKPNSASITLNKYNYIDARGRSNGCSRHMTGNIAYLSDFKQFDGGYVALLRLMLLRRKWFGICIFGCELTFAGISKEVGTPRYLSLVVPLTKVGDEAVHKELGDRIERAATTASSLEAEQDSGSGPRCQDTILGDVNAQTRFEITSKQSIDPPLSRGYTLGSGEDSMKLIGIDEILLKLVLSVLVSAVKRMLILPVQVSAVEVNPVIYTSCIEQFWATAKVQTVNGVRQLQALVDKKRVIVTESSIRRDLHLDDAEGTDCLPTATIFEELARMGAGKDFSGIITPLFDTMLVQLVKEMGEDSDNPTDSTPIPIIDQPSSSSQPKKDKPSKKVQRQEAEVPQDETEYEESVPTPSNNPQPSEENPEVRKEENIKTYSLKRLGKVSMSQRVKSFEDQESLGVPEDASKQGRVDGKDEQSTKTDDSTAGKVVATAASDDSVVPITNEEITLAQTLIQIKAAKPKVVTTAATTATTTRPKDKGVVVQEPSEFRMDAELLEEQKLARKQEEEANIALIESWENTQAMIEADRLLAERLQSKEREELTDEEKAKLFMD
ncbi:ribonuclease H-like domain-containing protein [Tanacetum coccineum]